MNWVIYFLVLNRDLPFRFGTLSDIKYSFYIIYGVRYSYTLYSLRFCLAFTTNRNVLFLPTNSFVTGRILHPQSLAKSVNGLKLGNLPILSNNIIFELSVRSIYIKKYIEFWHCIDEV